MRRNRIYIGKWLGFKTYLPCRLRFPSLFIHSDQASLQDLYLLHFLKMESALPCSSIVVTQKRGLIEKIKAHALGRKNVLYMDPDDLRTLSLNPIEQPGDFMFEGLVRSLLHKDCGRKAAELLDSLLKLVATEGGGRMALPALQALSGDGAGGLKHWLQQGKTPLRIALLNDVDKMDEGVLNCLLSEIAQGMGFLADDPVKRLFLEPTIYVPILFHEETVFLVHVSEKYEQAQRIIQLICHSIFLQIAGYPKKDSLKPLFFHFDSHPDLHLPDETLTILKAARVGLTSHCRDPDCDHGGIAAGIRLVDGKRGTITDGRRQRRFTPVFIENT